MKSGNRDKAEGCCETLSEKSDERQKNRHGFQGNVCRGETKPSTKSTPPAHEKEAK